MQGLLKPGLVPLLEDLLDSNSSSLRELQNLKERNMLDFGRKVSSRNIEAIFSEVKKEVDSFLDVKNITNPSLVSYSFFPKHAGLFWLYLANACVLTAAGLSFLYPPSLFQYFYAGLTTALSLSLAAYTVYSHSSIINDHNYYKHGIREIQLRRVERVKFINTLMHEYTHHVQNVKKLDFSAPLPVSIFSADTNLEYSIRIEGHARGVTRWLANTYREREDNSAFLYMPLNYTVGELKSVYAWMCSQLGLAGRSCLLSTKTEIDKIEYNSWVELGRPTPHAFGSAVFLMLETKYSSNLYKNIANNTVIV